MKFLLEQKRILEYEIASLRMDNEPISQVVYYTGNVNTNRVNRCVYHNSNGHLTEECRNYLGMQIQERINLIKEKQACWSCLKIGHKSKECRYKKKCEVDNCDRYHHHTLHAVNANVATLHTKILNENEKDDIWSSTCLLQIMKIPSVDRELSVLWVSGASISLATFKSVRTQGKGSEFVYI